MSALITCTWHLMTISIRKWYSTHTHTHAHIHTLTHKIILFFLAQFSPLFQLECTKIISKNLLLPQYYCNISSAWKDQMSSSDSMATATENASRLGYKHVCVNYLQVASHDYQYQEVIQHTHTHTSTHSLTKIVLFFLAQFPPLFQLECTKIISKNLLLPQY